MGDDEGTKLTDAFKEKIKLQAAFMNGLAIGVLLIGFFTPITRLAYDPTIRSSAFLSIALMVVICLMLGFVLHYSATKHLEGLDR